MLGQIRKFDLKKAGICSVVIGCVNILVHILVIAGIIPYLWVNGGGTGTFAQAQQISAGSIVMTIINILIATLPFSFVGIIQQFLGTAFEKSIMGIVTIIGFLADTRIALEKRW